MIHQNAKAKCVTFIAARYLFDTSLLVMLDPPRDKAVFLFTR